MKKTIVFIVLSILLPGVTHGLSDPLTLPHTFTGGTPIRSSEINANFEATTRGVTSSLKVQALCL